MKGTRAELVALLHQEEESAYAGGSTVGLAAHEIPGIIDEWLEAHAVALVEGTVDKLLDQLQHRSPKSAVRLMLHGHDGMDPAAGTCRGCGVEFAYRPATWTDASIGLHRHQWRTILGVPEASETTAGEREGCQCPPDHAMGFTVHAAPCRFAPVEPDVGEVEALTKVIAEARDEHPRRADDMDSGELAEVILAAGWRRTGGA